MKHRSIRFRGFSLVEVTLALGVAAFALLAVLGLLPVGINNNQASIQQTAATNFATAIIEDMEQVPDSSTLAANPSLSTKSPVYGIDVTSTAFTSTSPHVFYLDDGGGIQSSPSTGRYQVALTLNQPAAGLRNATTGSIKIGWPAANPGGYITVFVALDRN